jgi:hypothetical protein
MTEHVNLTLPQGCLFVFVDDTARLEDDFEAPVLYGFDLGTNALTAALAAARCLPFYGCNGGAFEALKVAYGPGCILRRHKLSGLPSITRIPPD